MKEKKIKKREARKKIAQVALALKEKNEMNKTPRLAATVKNRPSATTFVPRTPRNRILAICHCFSRQSV